MLLSLALSLPTLACAERSVKPATDATVAANASWYERLDFENTKEYENAARGLIEAPESVAVYREDGTMAWHVCAADYEGIAPDTVNPSLWRDTQINAYAGLFEVCDGIWQVRGHQAESGTWRNAYLVGALELRLGNQAKNATTSAGLRNMMREMTVEMLLDYIAIGTDANAAQQDELTLNLVIADTDERFFVHRRDGVLLVYPNEAREDAQATVTCARPRLLAALTGQTVDGITIEGDQAILQRLTRYSTAFANSFNVIEP